jgi:tetratricopeptide (TPR) repeat protein/transcriptional regulator with XRE-family HTH domain
MPEMSDQNEAAATRARPLTAAEQFGAAMRRLRLRQKPKMSLRALGQLVNYSYSVLSRMELGQLPPTIEAARAIDDVLGARGALLTLAEFARSEPYAGLPPKPPQFVGREQALQTLTSTLIDDAHPDRSTVAFVFGPPGVGKTALARWWANSHQDDFNNVLYADLRGFDRRQPAEAPETLERLLRGLGVHDDRIPAQPDMQLALLRGQLEHRANIDHRVLIVLDNARDSRQVAQILPGSRSTSVLVTSRARLSGLVINSGAEAIALQAMSKTDAATLIRNFVGDQRADAEPQAVARLASLCAFLPLALTIAAERIAGNDTLTIEQHTEMLAHRALELQVDDDETIGVRAAYSYSYDQLTPAQAQVFRMCGLHPGVQFSAESVAALAGIPTDDAFRVLDQLAQLSLLQALPARQFRLHDLLRDYAAEEAARPERNEERAEAIHRVVHWYLHAVNHAAWAITPERPEHHIRLDPPPDAVVPPTFKDFDAAYAWSLRELPTITGVAELARDHGMLYAAWRIPVECFDFYIHHRPVAVWIQSFEVAVDAAEKSGEALRIAQAAEELAEGYLRRGNPDDLDRAYALTSRAIEVCRGTLTRFVAFAYIEQGNIEFKRGNYERSAQLCEQAVTVAQAVAARVAETLARTHLGSAYRELGRLDLAMQHGLASFEILRAQDDYHGMGIAAVPLARTYRRAGDLDAAMRFCDEAVTAFRRREDFQGHAEALAERALVLAALGRGEDAHRTFTDALDRLSQIDRRTADAYEGEWQRLTSHSGQ